MTRLLSEDAVVLREYLDEDYLKYFKSYQTGIHLQPTNPSKLYSPVSGKVIYVGIITPLIGRVVVISVNNLLYRFMHLDDIAVEEGKSVRKGTLLGSVGEGRYNSNITFLHLDILKDVLPDKCFYDYLGLVQVQAHTVDPRTQLGDTLHML